MYRSRLLLLSLFVAGATALSAALPIEIPVGSPALAEAWGTQSTPVVASDGDGYLAVWYDYRTGVESFIGTRLSGSGEVLDPLGILILRSVSAFQQPKLVWSGTSYVLFWTTSDSSADPKVMALRVGRDGHAIGSPRVLASGTSSQLNPYGAVAANGSRIVVPYMKHPSTAEIRAVILDSEANMLADLLLGDTVVNRSLPTVAASRDEFLVVWELLTFFPPILEGVRLSSSGVPLDAKPRPVGSGDLPEIASDGRDFVIVSNRSPGGWATQKIPADLETSFQQYETGLGLSSPVPLWTGSQFNVYGISSNSIVRVSVDAGGRPSPAITEEQTRGTYAPFDAATNGRNVVKVWSDALTEGGSTAILGRVSAPSGAPDSGPPLVLSVSANGQRNVAVAYADNMALAAWCEENGVYATRITADGRSLDGRGVQLSSIANAGPPSVVFDGAQFVVAWKNGAQYLSRVPVVVKFISPAAGLLPETLQPGDTSADPKLIRGGEGAFVAWADGDTANVAMIGRASRALTGTPIVAGRPLQTGELIKQVDGAWNGTELLLAWREHRETGFGTHIGPSYYLRIRGARVNASLTLLDTAPLLLGDVQGDDDRDPAIASDGSGWLLVWVFGNDMHARRIARDGTAEGEAGGVVIGQGFVPRLTWDGSRYLAAWKAHPLYSPDGPTSREVRYAFLPRSGVLALSAPVPVSATYNLDTIALAPNSAGRFAIAYTRIGEEVPYGSSQRAFVRLFPVPSKQRAVR